MPAARDQTPRFHAIADVAARLFHEQGYDATSVQDLAEAAGLQKSSLYHHISSKEAVLEFICRRKLDDLDRGLQEAAVADTGPGDRVHLALRRATETALEDVASTSLILSQRDTTAVGRRVLDRRRDYDRDLAGLVAAGQEAGEVRDDIDPTLLTRLLLGMVNWLVVWYRPGHGDLAPEEVTDAVVALMDSAAHPRAPGTE